MNNILTIKNFKCFKNEKIELTNLNVLSGVNAVGKSSFIQSLLLMRQCGEKLSKKENKILLSGEYNLSLGTREEVINYSVDTNENIEFSIEGSRKISFKEQEEKKEKKGEILIEEHENFSMGEDINIPLLAKTFYYLNTERRGPQRVQRSLKLDELGCGYNGEYTFSIINENMDNKIEKGKREKNLMDVLTFSKQVEGWLNYITPGTSFKISKYDKINEVGLEFKREHLETDYVSPINFGFGISYVLPIIVSGMIAEKGSMFIVENPEAHLHPSAQSRIGEFLTQIAEYGVQVIIETHSEHVINGIRLAILKEKINSNKVRINYFNLDEEEKKIKIKAIKVNELGELTEWPDGFFDQEEQDLRKMFELRRKKR